MSEVGDDISGRKTLPNFETIEAEIQYYRKILGEDVYRKISTELLYYSGRVSEEDKLFYVRNRLKNLFYE